MLADRGYCANIFTMIAFAELLERLVFTPSRNAKIALLRRYFATQPDPDRGIGLAAITGELSFTAAKPGLIRELAAARTDPVLFAWSYDYVGDLAETVALMWPAAADQRARRRAWPRWWRRWRPHRRRRCRGSSPAGWTHRMPSVRLALLKLITGGLRVGASARLAKIALAEIGGVEPDDVEEVWHGLAPPYLALFAWLEKRGAAARSGRGAGVPPADAGASAGGGGPRRAAAGGLAGRMEMGRHPRAACRDRRRAAALFARRRGHLRRVSRNRRGDGFPRRAGRRTAGDARRAGRAVRRSAAAAEPQGGQRQDDGGLSGRRPALRHAVRRRRGRAPAAVRCAPRAAGGVVCAHAARRAWTCRR